MSRRDDTPPPATAAEREKAARQARLASALRVNLRRRKTPAADATPPSSESPPTYD